MSFKSIGVFCKSLFLLLMAVSLFGCATVRKPLTGIVPGRGVETLQSAIAVTAKSGERSTGGRGYLVYKAPDLFHLALLSPFGQAVLEAFGDSDRLTGLIPSRQTAYSGALSELPETSVLKSIGLLKWVMAVPPSPGPAPEEPVVISGDRFYFDRFGLLTRKVSGEGAEVTYERYRNVDGVAFPEAILIQNRYGASVRIVFDEPRINAPVEESALTPDFSGMVVLPLADFKAM